MAESFKIPNWTGKPPPGLHLDVMKNDTLIQKVMVDGKNSYFFGRGPQNDICIEHSSSSRIHAVLLHHKQLRMAFLVDLGSSWSPTSQLSFLWTPLPFGASTRSYLIREPIAPPEQEEMDEEKEDGKGVLLGLPATGTDLQNLTEFNTANNRRVSVVGIAIGDDSKAEEKKSKRKSFKQRVSFCEEEEIINLEDVDPSVGKFRNLVTSTVIPTFSKRLRFTPIPNFGMGYPRFQLDDYREPQYSSGASIHTHFSTPFSAAGGAGLDLAIPNSAPEVTETKLPSFSHNCFPTGEHHEGQDDGSKKTYVKEAWPGKRSGRPFS
ncbi:Nuclear inhibitor of protein phosphatase 1, partial [Orchesella cincta]